MDEGAAAGRLEDAKRVIEACRTERGFRASTQSYPDLWVRDLVYSEEALIRLGYGRVVRAHFESTLRLQRKGGQLPTAVSRGPRRILSQRYHFWTCDTEMLFVIGAMRYAKLSGDTEFPEARRQDLQRCVDFVEAQKNGAGLIPGMDWRDAMIRYRGKCLLANQVHLSDMHELWGEVEKARSVRDAVKEHFPVEDGESFADAVWWADGTLKKYANFDCLGHALAVLDGTAPPAMERGITRGFEMARTEHGIADLFPAYDAERWRAFSSIENIKAFVRSGAVLRNKPGSYQNSSIWPFVEAKVTEAYVRMGLPQRAKDAYRLALGRKGFYEWYSSATGAPGGSEGQLATASSIISMSRTAS